MADAATRIRVGSDPRISLETALVRACQGLGLPLLAMRLAALEQRANGSYGQPVGGAAAPAPAAAAAAAPSGAPPRPAQTTARPATTTAPATPAAAPAATAPAPALAKEAPAELDEEALGHVEQWWPKVAQLVAQTAAHRPMLQQLSPAAANPAKLLLRPEKPVPISAKLKEALTSATYEVTGRRLVVELLDPTAAAVSPPEPAAAQPAAAPSPAAPAAKAPAPKSAPAKVAAQSAPDEGIENLMSMFDATPIAPDDSQ